MALTVPPVGVGDDVLATYAAAVKAAIDDLYTVQVDTTVGSAAANFSSPVATVRTMLGGLLVFFTLQIVTDNALTAASGNITDTTCFTLDTAYRPAEAYGCAWGSNATGFAVMNTSGALVLWTVSDTVAAGSTLRISGTWLRA